MRHYEIILLLHPDVINEIDNIIKNYKIKIKNSKGIIHRLENWGRRQLAYPIKKLNKAHYILFNIESSKDLINDLKSSFKFDKNIIRNLIINVKKAITKSSIVLKTKDEKK
ncbi:30S ribosomal protein S6 [Sodalis-like secondary symbiont of Drepanosiphum platanoidis]|uniref:30S ribosomal protein S6 n=1 Tax=Sodalis-like secondary symbiont of Drepanosiphum platanoidis TaxID=2994493 RepID=UPI0034646F0D